MTQAEITAKLEAAAVREEKTLALREKHGWTIAHARRVVQEQS